MGLTRPAPRDGRNGNLASVPIATQARTTAMLAAVVFALCLAGIFSRMPGTLAIIWPANAVLLGLLLRNPSAATPLSWIGVGAAYVGADLVTGSDVRAAVLLNAANLLGILVGFYTARRFRPNGFTLTSGTSAAWLTALATLAAACAATIGAIAVTLLFDEVWIRAWLGWFAQELLNYAVILPIIVSWPKRGSLRAGIRPYGRRNLAIPIGVLLVSMPPAWFMEGFGTLAFSMPALIAAALLTDVFVTSLLIATSTVWSIVLIIGHGTALTTDAGAPVNPSAFIGLALLAAGPLATACAMAERKRIHRELRRAITQDDLTKAYRRGEFMRRAETIMAAAAPKHRPTALLMMDLDRFKRLNDSLGHQAGDQALIAFAETVRRCTGEDALFARLGGEEFALLLPDSDLETANVLAEKIRVHQEQRARHDFGAMAATVSIGLACAARSSATLDDLLSMADKALYRAKATRRNTVVIAENDRRTA